jgi:Flp pilus assembly protein TadD
VIFAQESLNLMALMRNRPNRLEDACRTRRRAVARQPNEPRQYLFRSKILEKTGRETEARAIVTQLAQWTAAQSRTSAN